MSEIMVYMTAPDVETARRIGRALVDRRLAACVNILPAIESMYWWKGAVQNGREVALIAKTSARNVDALIRKVRAVHSYDVPCVVSFPIAKGNPAFLRWVEKETQLLRRPSVR